MEDQKQQLTTRLKQSQNVLVTVSKNPSVDQLSAAIGLTLALNKLGKHATAVYSGETPSTLEFLKPEETLETNTDSLRDFIIALDKSKADKLRYKVEDQVVRIFITPYKTSISEADLDFSQGDFNVDIVVALGVTLQQDIDDAVQAHGRILHDATVSSISVEGQPEIGTLNVIAPDVSSLSEVVTTLIDQLDKTAIDNQIATALLTGIVATTERFSNDRTTPDTMGVSARLMSAGANQQLIVTELETPPEPEEEPIDDQVDGDTEVAENDLGTLRIDHDTDDDDETEDDEEPDFDQRDQPAEDDAPQVEVDAEGKLISSEDALLPKIGEVHGDPGDNDELSEGAHDESVPVVTRQRMVEPPSREGTLTANTEEESLDKPTEELTRPSDELPLLSHEQEPPEEMPAVEVASEAQPKPTTEPEPVVPVPTDQLPALDLAAVPPSTSPQAEQPLAVVDGGADDQTLADLEASVHSPHLATADKQQSMSTDSTVTDVSDARSAVEAALRGGSADAPLDPIAALNAQPLGPELHIPEPDSPQPAYQPAPGFGTTPASDGSASGATGLQFPEQAPAPASTFPGSIPAQQQDDSLPPPPPVPPPPIIPS